MIDDCDVSSGGQAIFGGKQIALDDLYARSVAKAASNGFQFPRVGGRPAKAPQIAESAADQTLDDSNPDKPGSSCHQDRVIAVDDPIGGFDPMILKRAHGHLESHEG